MKQFEYKPSPRFDKHKDETTLIALLIEKGQSIREIMKGTGFKQRIVQEVSKDYRKQEQDFCIKTQSRVCTSCGERKRFSKFHEEKGCLYGRKSQCMACLLQYQKDLRTGKRDDKKPFTGIEGRGLSTRRIERRLKPTYAGCYK